MIDYEAGTWGIGFILRIRGSVFPKALCWAIPNAILAAVLHEITHNISGVPSMNMGGVNTIWSGYTFVLGFLVVFRNNQAYTRFSEGAALIHKVRGEWIQTASVTIAFCTADEKRREEVEQFQHLFLRLLSMLHCSSLQTIRDVEDDAMEILSPEGIQQEQLGYLKTVDDRASVVLQWLCKLLVNGEKAGILQMAPPILARCYQELAKGKISLANVKQIADIQFPFPYAQILLAMMLVHWLITPILASQVCSAWHWAGLISFFVTVAFWSLLYIAMEIDQPFGDDPNDLPVEDMQREFNSNLLLMLDARVRNAPKFSMPVQPHEEVIPSWRSFRSLEALGLAGKGMDLPSAPIGYSGPEEQEPLVSAEDRRAYQSARPTMGP